MFAFLSSRHRKTRPVIRRACLTFEALEERYCLSAPTIINFQGNPSPSNYWTFSGQVTGPSISGLTVTFGGLASLQGQIATTSDNGYFMLTVQLQPGEGGQATAQTVDDFGQSSNMATYWVYVIASGSGKSG